MIWPGCPFKGGQFERFHCFPRSFVVDQLGLVESIDGFSHGTVVAVALAADSRFDPGLGGALGVADRNILHRRSE